MWVKGTRDTRCHALSKILVFPTERRRRSSDCSVNALLLVPVAGPLGLLQGDSPGTTSTTTTSTTIAPGWGNADIA
eukprot:1887473-Rhodomonas_salina.3